MNISDVHVLMKYIDVEARPFKCVDVSKLHKLECYSISTTSACTLFVVCKPAYSLQLVAVRTWRTWAASSHLSV